MKLNLYLPFSDQKQKRRMPYDIDLQSEYVEENIPRINDCLCRDLALNDCFAMKHR